MKEETSGPFQKAWAALVALAAKIFENREEKQVATKIPVRGDIEDPKAGIIPAIVNLARNAFIAAFSHSLEDSITLSDRDSTVKVQCPEAEKKSKSKKKQKKNAC